ncbi:MAG: GNA1162 family protein [Elusimicrobiota bacterium]
MKNSGLIFFLFCISIFAAGCATPPITRTKQEAFPKMYENHPLSILILPPINQTTAADAKEYYSATIAEPLSEMGYYVYPLEVTSDILKDEGIYDTELLSGLPMEKFKQYFGADAVLYIKLIKWDTAYYVLGGNITVAVDLLLRSTVTGEDLWKYSGNVVVNTTGDSGDGSLAGLIAQIIGTAIITATSDYLPAAKQANVITCVTMPYGKYHENFEKDQNNIVYFPSEEGLAPSPQTSSEGSVDPAKIPGVTPVKVEAK